LIRSAKASPAIAVTAATPEDVPAIVRMAGVHRKRIVKDE
jgi:hypothetical protein